MLKMDMFEHEVLNNGGIRIRKYTGEGLRVDVPEELEGRPVTEVGDYAFSGTAVTALSLPRTLTRMGRYALYNCRNLEELEFGSALMDFGAGTFTGCHRIKKLTVNFPDEERSALREVLAEVAEELIVEYVCEGQKAMLVFPEFFEEGVENTPARIIESHTHGSGMYYRNCFVNRRLQFEEYDARFPYAVGQEREELLIRLSLYRLRYPYRCSPSASEIYMDYIQKHFDAAIRMFTRTGEVALTSFLMSRLRAAAPAKAPDLEL